MATFWQRVKTLFGGEAPKSAGALLSSILQGGQMPRRGTRELLLAYARLPWVHSVVKRIASDVAGVPVTLYRERRASAKAIRRATGPVRRAMVQDARRAGDIEEVEAHPFLDLWRTWNPALGGHVSRMVLQEWLDLAGEGFAVQERNGLALPVELWPVPPHWMADTPSTTAPFFRASYLGWQRNFPEQDVSWFKMPNPENPYARGTGLGEALGDELDIDESSTKLLRNWFFNSAIPPVIINLPEVGDAERERFKERLFQDHQGPQKANRVMISNALAMDVKVLTQTFKEQEIPALRAAAKEIVVQVFNVPPEMMGIIENSNRATIDAADYLYTKGVICPRMDFLVDALQPLADQFDESLFVDYVSPVAEDKEFKRAVYLQAPPGTFTRDEYRALAGEPPMEPGSETKQSAPIVQYHLSFGIVTINEVRATLDLPPLPDGDVPPKPVDLFGLGGEGEAMAAPRLVERSLPRLPARTKNAADIERILESLRPERLTEEVAPVWERRMAKWGQRVLRELGIDGSFSMKNPLIVEHLEKLSANKITGLIQDTTRQAIRDTLAEGVAAGEGVELLSSRVMDVFDLADKVRARRIARTEVVGSSNLTNLAAFQQSGVVASKEWLSVRDGNTRTEHAELDGQTVGVMEAFSVDGHRAQHPGGFGMAELDINCFPSDAVFAPDSRVLRLYRRTYVGPMVTLDIEGHGSSRSTPNHPVLTAERGWQPAEALQLGEHVVCLVKEAVGLGVDDPQGGQAVVAEEVFSALAPLGIAERVAGTAAQFHGDGRNEEVDVVALDWRLWSEVDSALTQEACEVALSIADQPGAAGGTLAQFLYGPLHSAHGSMRGLGQLLALLSARAAHPNEHRRTATAWLNAGLDKVATHCGPRAAEALRELFLADASLIESYQATARQLYRIGARAARAGATDGDAALPHPSAERIGAPLEGVANLRERFPGQVTLRRILNLSVADFRGHVFNLETESNWYVADGIARHNCRCAVLPVVEPAKALGGLVLTRAMSEEEKTVAWKRYDKRLLPWEREAAAALRRGFREQESDVLEALQAQG